MVEKGVYNIVDKRISKLSYFLDLSAIHFKHYSYSSFIGVIGKSGHWILLSNQTQNALSKFALVDDKNRDTDILDSHIHFLCMNEPELQSVSSCFVFFSYGAAYAY